MPPEKIESLQSTEFILTLLYKDIIFENIFKN